MTEALAPVAAPTASATVSKIGTLWPLSNFWPPLPGVTPPTIGWVP
jgi:hypothetical protein